MIELRDVWKGERKATRKDQWALAGVRLAFPAGYRIGLIGSNAAHNTVALRIMAGVESPERGVVRRSGVPCWPFDFANFVDSKASISQNANFLSQVYGVNSADVLRITTHLSGVKPVRGKPMSQYTGPDRRSISLGLTLSLQFDWYFVDEKLPRFPDETAELIEAVVSDRMSHASVIWATTKPETLEGFCNAGLLLDQGSMTFYTDYQSAVDAFNRANETKIVKKNDRKPRKAGGPGSAARSEGEVDTENAR